MAIYKRKSSDLKHVNLHLVKSYFVFLSNFLTESYYTGLHNSELCSKAVFFLLLTTYVTKTALCGHWATAGPARVLPTIG
jgi:hypothetical protein